MYSSWSYEIFFFGLLYAVVWRFLSGSLRISGVLVSSNWVELDFIFSHSLLPTVSVSVSVFGHLKYRFFLFFIWLLWIRSYLWWISFVLSVFHVGFNSLSVGFVDFLFLDLFFMILLELELHLVNLISPVSGFCFWALILGIWNEGFRNLLAHLKIWKFSFSCLCSWFYIFCNGWTESLIEFYLFICLFPLAFAALILGLLK